MRKVRSILLFAVILLYAGVNYAQKSVGIDKSQFKLSWNEDKLNLYHREPAVLTLYLWTPGYEIRDVRKSKSSSLSKGKFSFLQRADIITEPRIVEKDGKIWYVYPIDSYAIAIDKAGKYDLHGGRYIVDVAVPQIYDDPFWGKMQTMRTERIEVPVSPVQIEVKDLPQTDGNSDFSGAVGDFDVTVNVPPGDIFLNEEATAIVTVVGKGWLNNGTLPEYHDAFRNGTKLKSFSENRIQYLKDGVLISELQMECTFIPTSKDNAVIDPIWIEIFNPETGTYEIVKSKPVKVKVQSIADKAPEIDI